MGKYKKLINEIVKQEKEDVKISDYFSLLGYSDKHTFTRSLRNRGYEIFFKNEKIQNRIGKEHYMHTGDLIKLLNEHLIADNEWKSDYKNYLYINFKNKVFRFRETASYVHRSNLGGYVSAKGVFYNYSLNTLAFAKEVSLCPYLCYKIANTTFAFRSLSKSTDYDSKIPTAYFDDRNWHTRSLFLLFIDMATKELAKTDAQRIVIEAYRMAIVELLNRQSEIDNKSSEADKLLEAKNAEELKNCYREACKLFHPDTNKNPEAEEIMKQINNFYEDKNMHGIKDILSKTKRTI